MVRSSRAIDDLDIPSIDVAPNKANAPLIVDAGVVPPLPVASQHFQAIARRDTNIFKICRRVDCQ
jgi:hypothetical protein